ncbi:hypothetical protein SAR116_1640 [Candidatus Puniceispirillum marinum IMCC1322]|uniref:Uncharacterized protein n=1 Tax=Puniceispirillum marinum (strain IMCC1322) TaxID=488538 RepID=D5BUD6_PUNMI|nr:hypothetical protein SAR116_1640 [Candidatus Puniceispirillum marinum IMCC1322]
MVIYSKIRYAIFYPQIALFHAQGLFPSFRIATGLMIFAHDVASIAM